MIGFLKYFKTKKIFTFSYYIPAPPSRNTPYHERQFDQLTERLTLEGHKIVDIKLQSVSNENSSGTLVIVLYRPKSVHTPFIISESSQKMSQEDQSRPEGLYYLD